MSTISILGCGWFGFHFANILMNDRHQVNGSTTSESKLSHLASVGIKPYRITVTPQELAIDASFFDCEILVITIPPRSNSMREYLMGINNIIHEIRQHRISKVIFISSTSVFGDVNGHVNEITPTAPTTEPGKYLVAAELLFKDDAFATTVVRFGGLVGDTRDPGKFFAGKKYIPNGQAPVNLIHQEDCSGICRSIINQNSFGHTIHACSPDHPKKQDFYTLASLRSKLLKPEFVDELNGWKIVDSINTARLLSYEFQVGDWMRWLKREAAG